MVSGNIVDISKMTIYGKWGISASWKPLSVKKMCMHRFCEYVAAGTECVRRTEDCGLDDIERG